MSQLMNSGWENAMKRSYKKNLCSFCLKSFDDLRALGDHLKSHQGHALSRISPLTATVAEAEAAPHPLMGPPPFLPRRFGYESWENHGKIPENSIGNAKSSFLVSSNFSPDGDRAEICHLQSWSYLLNSDQSRSFEDDGQLSENALSSIQNRRDQGNFSNPRFGSSSKYMRVPVSKEPISEVPVFPGLNQYSGLGESDGYNNGKRYSASEDFPVPTMVKRARAECSLMIDEGERLLNSIDEPSLLQHLPFEESPDNAENPKLVLDLTLRPAIDLTLRLSLPY